MERALGAELSHMLKARGVDVVFGIPGVHNIEMYRGIEEAQLTHILARHEQGAAFMADGYARASGRPGVCYLITGPGFVNAMTGLGQAYSDSVSVLALASCLDEIAASRGQLHQMKNQEAAGATVCDWSLTAFTPEAAYALVDRALSEFASARPRPKAVHVPIFALGARAPAAPAPLARPAPAEASQAMLTEVVKAVLAAEKPLFVFGGGAVAGGAAVADVLRQTGAASFATYAGRGLVPQTAPLHFGSYLARPSSAEIFAQADLVIAVGTELSEVDLWRTDPGHTCRMIRIDLDPEVLGQGRAGDLAVLGEAGAFLRAMAVAIPARVDDRSPCWDAAQVARWKARWRDEVRAERPGIVEVSDALRAVMPEDAMIYSDMTQFAYGAKEVWDVPRPGHWHHPSGFGTLGYALPAAIGGAVARPGLPTCAIIGDYGLQYTLPELGTAVELGVSLPILVWDNAALGEIRDGMVRAQFAPNAVEARNPDFLALARAYGAKAETPPSLDALQQVVSEAFSAGCPTLIRMTPALVGRGV